ncbi:mechanosensitive ion channel [Chloroflexota bacterium]
MDDDESVWDSITDSFETAIDNIFDYIPQVVGALVLLLLAWILAKVVRGVVRRAIETSKIEEKIGKGGNVAERGGQAAWWGVWIFFFLAILQTLGVDGMLEPIRLTFEKIFDAIPDIIAAAVILIASWIIGRILVGWVRGLLVNARFDELPVKLGITQKSPEGNWAPSNIASYIVLVIIMLFAVMMAADILEFPTANNLVADFTEFFAQVILGVVVLAVGVFLAKFVASLMRAAKQPPALATLVQVFIIILVSAIGLYTMGFANGMIMLGFGLIMGAIAVAFAIAFGIGGREVARDLMESWVKSLRSDKSKESDK